MKMRLSKLQDDNKQAKKLRSKRLQKDWKNIKKMFYYKNFLKVLKVICPELIGKYYNNLLVDYFSIEKT